MKFSTKSIKIFKFTILCLFIITTFNSDVYGSEEENPIKALIKKLRNEPRGPYKDIRWFCEDGNIIEPKSACPGKGNQHARMNDEVNALAKNKNIYLSQILTGTQIADFWDEEHAQSRLIQYQLEKYLFDVDRGWINERGQYYRGAKQVEDEMEWGRDFFLKILQDKKTIRDKYLLLRRAARDIPHGVDDNQSQNIRALSQEISDAVIKFQNIRIKIHGLPQESDIDLVKDFQTKEKATIDPSVDKKIEDLLIAMKKLYSKSDTLLIKEYLKSIPRVSVLDSEVKSYLVMLKGRPSSQNIVEKSADLLDLIRSEILNVPRAKTRLDLIDLSNKMEDRIIIEANNWQPQTLNEALEKMCLLNTAMKGGGYINSWEWKMIYEAKPENKISTSQLDMLVESYRRAIQWGTGMVYAFYKNDVSTFTSFETKAAGFNDNIIRSSPLLAMGYTLDMIHSFYAQQINLGNSIFNLKKQAQVKGINPGFAKGVLEVIDNFEDNPTLDPNKIYVFNQPPRELKPLAGIATVTEGNVVSHVQLLARNLGIPNAALSLETLNDLKKYNGKEIFYAVSNKGTVIMKEVNEMTDVEKNLFKKESQKKDKITIALEKLKLDEDNIINIRQIDASFSGKVCGPKAANLAQLKAIFPEKVVEGFVIPFGIYKKHMEQKIPGRNESYWQYIHRVLYYLNEIEPNSMPQDALDRLQRSMLDSLRNEITNIKLLPAFETALRDSFQSVFKQKMGSIPVFLRSDTNMEDLKEFTGAGLNLTLFNALDQEKIIKGIKEVWASPFSERSYKWRQKYLNNPENIFPSILVIPSVDVEKSGVLITKGIANNNPEDLTIAFSQGVGGAVDGQAAETYLAYANGGNVLMSPSRENIYKSIPMTGGTNTNNKTPGKNTNFAIDITLIRDMAEQIKKAMPRYGMEGPYDVELGIKEGKIWLFQIRPFVENKNAISSAYLQSITPIIDYQKEIDMNSTLL